MKIFRIIKTILLVTLSFILINYIITWKRHTKDQALRPEKIIGRQESEAEFEIPKGIKDYDEELPKTMDKEDFNNVDKRKESNKNDTTGSVDTAATATAANFERNADKGKLGDRTEFSEPENDLLEQNTTAYKREIKYEEISQEARKTFEDVVKLARTILSSNKPSKIVLLTFIGEDNTMFANSWLCNTKDLDLHSSLLMVTYGNESHEFLVRKWPRIKSFALKPNISEMNLRNRPMTLQKLQIIIALLHSGINVLLFNVESVWFANPLPSFKTQGGNDMLVNFISKSHVNDGFIVLFATEGTQLFWVGLYRTMNNSGNNLHGSYHEEMQYNRLLENMLIYRSRGIKLRELPTVSYTESTWYSLSPEERNKTKPIVIRTNFDLGFANRIQLASRWKHWFVKQGEDGGVCDTDRVRKLVLVLPSAKM